MAGCLSVTLACLWAVPDLITLTTHPTPTGVASGAGRARVTPGAQVAVSAPVPLRPTPTTIHPGVHPWELRVENFPLRLTTITTTHTNNNNIQTLRSPMEGQVRDPCSADRNLCGVAIIPPRMAGGPQGEPWEEEEEEDCSKVLRIISIILLISAGKWITVAIIGFQRRIDLMNWALPTTTIGATASWAPSVTPKEGLQAEEEAPRVIWRERALIRPKETDPEEEEEEEWGTLIIRPGVLTGVVVTPGVEAV